MNNGWIILHRKTTDWEWYTDANTARLFFHLLLSANHKQGKWRGIIIDSGCTLTSRDKLAEELRLTVQQIRTSLNKLKSTGEITIKTTNKYSIISITNWESYQQNNQQYTKPATNKQPTNNQQITTNNNNNNNNNENNEKEIEIIVLAELNKLTNSAFRNVESNLKLIRERIKEGNSVNDILDVISMKVEEWTDTKWEQYLRPSTLFNAEKFNQYVGQLPEWRKEKSGNASWLDDDYIEGMLVDG